MPAAGAFVFGSKALSGGGAISLRIRGGGRIAAARLVCARVRGGVVRLTVREIFAGLPEGVKEVTVETGRWMTLGKDYLVTARAKGLNRTRVIVRHAFPNGLLPLITLIGIHVGTLMAGAFSFVKRSRMQPHAGTMRIVGVILTEWSGIIVRRSELRRIVRQAGKQASLAVR